MPTIDVSTKGVTVTYPPGGPSSAVIVDATRRFSSWTITKNANWRRLKPITAFERSWSFDGPSYSVIQSRPSTGSDWTTVFSNYHTPIPWDGRAPSLGKTALNRAVDRLASSIQEEGGSTNLLTTGGELGKTLSMVASTATRLTRFVRSLKRLDIDGAAEALGYDLHPRRRRRLVHKRSKFIRSGKPRELFPAQVYLEYRYGWSPLMYDLSNTMKALASLDNNSENFTITKSKKATAEASGSYVVSLSTTHEVTVKQTAVVSVTYRLGSDAIASIKQFGLQNGAATVWELVPFSFVVDWFIPVGKFLENMNYDFGLIFVRGFQNVKTETFVLSRRITTTATNIESSFGKRYEGRFRRDPLTLFPSVRWPTAKNPLNVNNYHTRISDAIALLAVTTRGR